MWHLGERRSNSVWVSVGKFQGQVKVNIRHHFQLSPGAWQATKKGVALTLEEWDKFKEEFDNIDLEVRRIRSENESSHVSPLPKDRTDGLVLLPFGNTYTPNHS